MLAGSARPSAAAAPLLLDGSAGRAAGRADRKKRRHSIDRKTGGPALSGTITETASRSGCPPCRPGCRPSCPAAARRCWPANPHTVQVWYASPDHFRLALPQSLSEDDLVRNGGSTWLWDSADNTVTHLRVPSDAALPAFPSTPLTPQQAAGQALAQAGPPSRPRGPRRDRRRPGRLPTRARAEDRPLLVAQVRIAIDSQHRVPLQVQVFARGAANPATQIWFTAVSFGRPPAADYAFTPPAGARVTQPPRGAASPGTAARTASGLTSDVRVIGTGWLTVASLPQSSLAELTGSAGGWTGSRSAIRPSPRPRDPPPPRRSGAPALGTARGSATCCSPPGGSADPGAAGG